MPTGYTEKLMTKGQSFKEFAMLCARNFGACVTMRDDPFDAPIPHEFKPSDYSLHALEEAKRRLGELESMTTKERVEFGKSEKSKIITQYKELIREESEQNARLDKVLAMVQKWEPPTEDHLGLKEFMLQQLDISRNDTAYFVKELSKEEKRAPSEFYNSALAKARREVVYYAEENTKEIDRCKKRSEWVQQLRNSLKA